MTKVILHRIKVKKAVEGLPSKGVDDGRNRVLSLNKTGATLIKLHSRGIRVALDEHHPVDGGEMVG